MRAEELDVTGGMPDESVSSIRTKAVRARRLARELRDPVAKEALLEMARELEAAAGKQERDGHAEVVAARG